MRREDLEAIAPVIQKHDLFVLSDEIYSELTYGSISHVSIASVEGMWERTVVINGFSKTYSMTGWRLGYAACSEEIVKTVNKLHQHVVTCATSVGHFLRTVHTCYPFLFSAPAFALV